MSLASKPSKVRIFSWGVTSFQGTSLRCQGVKSESSKGVIITHIQKKKLKAQWRNTDWFAWRLWERERQTDLYLGSPQNPPSLSPPPSLSLSVDVRRVGELYKLWFVLYLPQVCKPNSSKTLSTEAAYSFELVSQQLFFYFFSPFINVMNLLSCFGFEARLFSAIFIMHHPAGVCVVCQLHW